MTLLRIDFVRISESRFHHVFQYRVLIDADKEGVKDFLLTNSILGLILDLTAPELHQDFRKQGESTLNLMTHWVILPYLFAFLVSA